MGFGGQVRFGASAVLIRVISVCAYTAPAISGQPHDCFENAAAEVICCYGEGHDECWDDDYTRSRCCADFRDELVSFSFSRLVKVARRNEEVLRNSTLLFAMLLGDIGSAATLVEVGVQRGSFSAGVLGLLAGWGQIDRVREVFLIDIWRHIPGIGYEDRANVEDQSQIRVFRAAIDALAPFWPKVRFIQSDSNLASRLFQDESVDFVYVDARHDYCGVLEDLETYWPKLRQGGLMGGDDYGWSNTWVRCANGTVLPGGVKRAVTDYFGRIGLRIAVASAQWFAIKP